MSKQLNFRQIFSDEAIQLHDNFLLVIPSGVEINLELPFIDGANVRAGIYFDIQIFEGDGLVRLLPAPDGSTIENLTSAVFSFPQSIGSGYFTSFRVMLDEGNIWRIMKDTDARFKSCRNALVDYTEPVQVQIYKTFFTFPNYYDGRQLMVLQLNRGNLGGRGGTVFDLHRVDVSTLNDDVIYSDIFDENLYEQIFPVITSGEVHKAGNYYYIDVTSVNGEEGLAAELILG